jgi:hypothetical protein
MSLSPGSPSTPTPTPITPSVEELQGKIIYNSVPEDFCWRVKYIEEGAPEQLAYLENKLLKRDEISTIDVDPKYKFHFQKLERSIFTFLRNLRLKFFRK